MDSTQSHLDTSVTEPTSKPRLRRRREPKMRERQQSFEQEYRHQAMEGGGIPSLFLVLFVGVAFLLGHHWLTWTMFAMFAVTLSGVLVVNSMPKAIARLQLANCFRPDGSWSKGRALAERQSRAKLRMDLYFGMTLAVLPTILGLWIVNQHVIPLGLATDSIMSLRLDEEQTRANLEDEGRKLEKWYKSSSALNVTDVNAQDHKRALWRTYPLLIVFAVLWILVSFSALSSFYLYLLKQLRINIKTRSESYYWRDLSRASTIDAATSSP